MKKKDLIKLIKNIIEIEEKEIEIESYNYFSPEINMWRKRFLEKEGVFEKSVLENFLSVLSENLMKNSPEEILEIFSKKINEDDE